MPIVGSEKPHWGEHNLSNRSQILIIDHQPIVRLGARKLLDKSPELDVVWECSSCREALHLLDDITPNLIISEALFPGDECVLTFIKEVLGTKPTIPILVVSSQNEDLLAERVLKSGGSGFVSKSASPTEVLTAIQTVLGGEIYMSSHMASRAIRHYSHNHSHPAETVCVDRLSNRELEIFNLIGGDHSRQLSGVSH